MTYPRERLLTSNIVHHKINITINSQSSSKEERKQDERRETKIEREFIVLTLMEERSLCSANQTPPHAKLAK